MADLRFCAYQYAHLPIPQLVERWRRAELLGFDVLWNCDAMNEPDHPRMTMFESTSILTAMALHTSTIRVGTLVTTLIYRNPAVIAKTAMTIDHLSGGRLELGVGGGVLETDHAASGVPWWKPPERVDRYREAVALIDRMLRNGSTTVTGTYYGVDEADMVPLPVQRPRPPITIPAHGPSMLRIAAELADSWSSWGGYQIETEQQMYEVTRDRSRRFDDLCAEVGRDPATIRHSLVVFPPLTPWRSADAFSELVGRYREIGIDEFVQYWPGNWTNDPNEGRVFEEVAAAVIPALRRAG